MVYTNEGFGEAVVELVKNSGSVLATQSLNVGQYINENVASGVRLRATVYLKDGEYLESGPLISSNDASPGCGEVRLSTFSRGVALYESGRVHPGFVPWWSDITATLYENTNTEITVVSNGATLPTGDDDDEVAGSYKVIKTEKSIRVRMCRQTAAYQASIVGNDNYTSYVRFEHYGTGTPVEQARPQRAPLLSSKSKSGELLNFRIRTSNGLNADAQFTSKISKLVATTASSALPIYTQASLADHINVKIPSVNWFNNYYSEPFDVKAVVTDIYGNLCDPWTGTFYFKEEYSDGTEPQITGLPASVTVTATDEGRYVVRNVTLSGYPTTNKWFRVLVSDQSFKGPNNASFQASSLVCYSNWMYLDKDTIPEYRLYYGDYHNHFWTDHSDTGGYIEMREPVNYMRYTVNNDWWASGDHDTTHLASFWQQYQDEVNLWYEPGVFTTLLGYEWTYPGHHVSYIQGHDIGNANYYPSSQNVDDGTNATSCASIDHSEVSSMICINEEIAVATRYHDSDQVPIVLSKHLHSHFQADHLDHPFCIHDNRLFRLLELWTDLSAMTLRYVEDKFPCCGTDYSWYEMSSYDASNVFYLENQKFTNAPPAVFEKTDGTYTQLQRAPNLTAASSLKDKQWAYCKYADLDSDGDAQMPRTAIGSVLRGTTSGAHATIIDMLALSKITSLSASFLTVGQRVEGLTSGMTAYISEIETDSNNNQWLWLSRWSGDAPFQSEWVQGDTDGLGVYGASDHYKRRRIFLSHKPYAANATVFLHQEQVTVGGIDYGDYRETTEQECIYLNLSASAPDNPNSIVATKDYISTDVFGGKYAWANDLYISTAGGNDNHNGQPSIIFHRRLDNAAADNVAGSYLGENAMMNIGNAALTGVWAKGTCTRCNVMKGLYDRRTIGTSGHRIHTWFDCIINGVTYAPGRVINISDSSATINFNVRTAVPYTTSDVNTYTSDDGSKMGIKHVKLHKGVRAYATSLNLVEPLYVNYSELPLTPSQPSWAASCNGLDNDGTNDVHTFIVEATCTDTVKLSTGTPTAATTNYAVYYLEVKCTNELEGMNTGNSMETTRAHYGIAGPIFIRAK